MSHKITILTISLLFTLSWVNISVSPFFENSAEKHITERKEALPESEFELEKKTFEVVYAFLSNFTPPLQTKIAVVVPFSKNISFPESLTLDSLKPPPKLS